MSILIALAALGLLMLAAYRGYSVILFAPIAALGAVLLTDPSAVAPAFTGLFMDKMVGFIKLYFPVFLLGAVFGKLIELSGFSRSIVAAAIRLLGRKQAIPVIVAVCALLTYGGGVAVRRGVRSLSIRRRDVSPNRHSQKTDAGDNRPRCVLFHDGCVTRHTADPEYYPHQFFQDYRLGGPMVGIDRFNLRGRGRSGIPGTVASTHPACR